MEDLVVYEAKVITEGVDEVEEVAYQAERAADPTHNVPYRPDRQVVVPTPWDEGIAMCRTAIQRYTNQIIARNKNFLRRPASDY